MVHPICHRFPNERQNSIDLLSSSKKESKNDDFENFELLANEKEIIII